MQLTTRHRDVWVCLLCEYSQNSKWRTVLETWSPERWYSISLHFPADTNTLIHLKLMSVEWWSRECKCIHLYSKFGFITLNHKHKIVFAFLAWRKYKVAPKIFGHIWTRNPITLVFYLFWWRLILSKLFSQLWTDCSVFPPAMCCSTKKPKAIHKSCPCGNYWNF